ncbi:DUF4097 domain-containing protein [Kitasatospora sp. NBC_00240]|uniref:DUF4097 family beta strand repeat-containing protein n=1 Tax=Kitasatospora sp. NBC_00240 TaxID=2903567 RepID=UPI00225819C1|nr:DUF4097 family beta strand repeat-containing protein [Kitasatospora sp. NBC_00240]MCX5210842.1 DUF4097 domain-containing protein [Kitasatospora sp. NBC_00240]
MSQWTVSEPDRITIDEPVGTLHVRIIDGAVNVVAAEGPARLEVTELEGEPLHVTLENGVLTVTYKNLNWGELGEAVKSVQSVKELFSSLRKKRRAVVSLAVPAGSEVKIGTVSADSTVSGVSGHVAVHGASGATTLVGLSGRTEANSVSGDVDAQSVSGELKVKTVSGGITVVAGTADRLSANSVSGAVTLDLDVETPSDIKVNTVSGAVGVRLPSLADAKVEAGTNSGDVSSTFEQLKVNGTWGAKKLSGQLGDGKGSLQVTTVSGAVTVLHRPDTEDEGPVVVKELPAGPDLTKEA